MARMSYAVQIRGVVRTNTSHIVQKPAFMFQHLHLEFTVLLSVVILFA